MWKGATGVYWQQTVRFKAIFKKNNDSIRVSHVLSLFTDLSFFSSYFDAYMVAIESLLY